MYRKIFKYLKEWKENPYRKPLILQGTRQVGKTHSVLTFGKQEYENVAYDLYPVKYSTQLLTFFL